MIFPRPGKLLPLSPALATPGLVYLLAHSLSSQVLAVTVHDPAGLVLSGLGECARSQDAARGARAGIQGQDHRGALRGPARSVSEASAQATAVPGAADLRLHLPPESVQSGRGPAAPHNSRQGVRIALPTSLVTKQYRTLTRKPCKKFGVRAHPWARAPPPANEPPNFASIPPPPLGLPPSWSWAPFSPVPYW